MDKMLNIAWITADYFIDVDFLLVPYLRKKVNVRIDWFILQNKGSKLPIPSMLDARVIKLEYGKRDPRSIVELYLKLRKLHLKQYDIVYSDVVGTKTYHRSILHLARKTPVIHAAHNVIQYPVWPQNLIRTVNYIFSHHSYFQLFSKFAANYFCEHYPNKSMFYCPMTMKGYGAVSTDKYSMDNTRVNLLFFGNVIDNKRLDLLIEAVKTLPNEINDKVRLIIAGDDKGFAIKLNEQIGDARNILTYFGRVPDEDVAELFSKCQFLVLPYEDVAQSGPHMIAYYYDVPVIASDIDGFTERIEDGINGFLFKKNDIESLQKAIIKAVFTTKEDYSMMRKNLHSYAEANFGLEAVSTRYLNYFRCVTKKV